MSMDLKECTYEDLFITVFHLAMIYIPPSGEARYCELLGESGIKRIADLGGGSCAKTAYSGFGFAKKCHHVYLMNSYR